MTPYHRSEPPLPYAFGQGDYQIRNRYYIQSLNRPRPKPEPRKAWNKGIDVDTYNMDGLKPGQSRVYKYKTDQDAHVSSRRMRNHARERGCKVKKAGRVVTVWREP